MGAITPTDLTTNSPGFGIIVGNFPTRALGINNSGVVVGDYWERPGSSLVHGFISNPPYTSPVTIDPPNSIGTAAYAINDSGSVVGKYFDSTDTASHGVHGFLFTGGNYTQIDFPGAFFTEAYGINNAGQVVGVYGAQQGPVHGFLLSGGAYTSIDFPGASNSAATSINNLGVISGIGAPEIDDRGEFGAGDCFLWNAGVIKQVNFGNAAPHGGCSGINDFGELVGQTPDPAGSGKTFGFFAFPGEFVDPVGTDLVQNMAVIGVTDANKELLATKGRLVFGVAADGASELLLRIPSANVGDQIVLSVLDDQNPPQPSTSSDSYGALGFPGDSSATINSNSFNQITVTAVDTKEGPMAFAVYRAPIDFPRTTGQDADSSKRQAFIQVGSGATPMTVNIVRPLLVMIHGLWGGGSTFNAFDGTFHFITERLNYDEFAPLIKSSIPSYGIGWKASANSLGYFYNASNVFSRLQSKIKAFKQGDYPVAAVRADVLAHSMGGDITRMLPDVPNFLSNLNLGQGLIHKVITIDTPHQGSPLATALLQDNNKCVRNLLGRVGSYSFDSVTFYSGASYAGAVGDLTPDRTDLLLNTLHTGPSIPVAFIAGRENSVNLAGLDNHWLPKRIHSHCGDSPLGASFTSQNWPTIFGEDSDGIVGLTSQLNGLAASAPFEGRVHGIGTTSMGLDPPTMTDADVAQKVLDLLNTPVTNTGVFKTVP